MSATLWACLVSLGALWGASFAFLGLAVADLGPYMTVQIRMLIGAAILWAWTGNPFSHPLLREKRKLAALTAVSLLNAAIPYCLFALVVSLQGAAFGAILNATAPLFASLLAIALLREKPRWTTLLGVLIGFAGTVALIVGRSGPIAQASWIALALGLSGSAMYATSALISRHHLSAVPSKLVATASCAVAALALLPVGLTQWPAHPVSLRGWAGAAGLGVLSTALGHVLYFKLVSEAGPHRALSVTYLVPVFGLLWSALILGERLSLLTIACAIVVLVGVVLAVGQPRPRT